MLRRKVEDTIIVHSLFSHSATILVALSGGADSVAMLRILKELGYNCKALHCNFHLRGNESDRDEQFVRNLCQETDTELLVTHFKTKEYAEQNKLSIEMAARELRYAWFEECVNNHTGDVVAIAHNSDDCVETFLLNLTRGTGINGLKGIKVKNGNIARPLLKCSRDEITAYLKSIGQEYMTDSTNLQNEYTRNKVRLDIIPLFEKINPSFKHSVLDTAERLAEAAAIYDNAIAQSKAQVYDGNCINIEKLKAQVSPPTLLFEILHPLGFNSSQINDILKSIDGQPGKKFISRDYEVTKDRDSLIITPTDQEDEATVQLEEVTHFSKGTLLCQTTAKDEKFTINKDRNIALIDKSKIKGSLKLRKWRYGDNFVPLGMKGKKNISDYLTDRKISLKEKDRTYVITDDGNIVWIVGERIDDRYKITDRTKEITTISFMPKTTGNTTV